MLHPHRLEPRHLRLAGQGQRPGRRSKHLERFAALPKARTIQARVVDAWSDAFRFIQLLRLRLNAVQQSQGHPPHNHLDPSSLNDLERQFLKESLRQARNLQSRLVRDFSAAGPSMGAGARRRRARDLIQIREGRHPRYSLRQPEGVLPPAKFARAKLGDRGIVGGIHRRLQ